MAHKNVVTSLNHAAQWLYDLGVPLYQALAFGDYFAERGHMHNSLSAAKTAFDYDPRGHELCRHYGRQTNVIERAK